MPRTFAYLRVSTTGQTTDNQLQEIAAAGFKVEPRRVVTETVSGNVATSQRRGFTRLLDQLEPGDVLVVTKLDRLARNVMHVGPTVAKLAELAVRVHCLALGGVDLTSSTGKLTMNVINAVAEFERDLLIEPTQAGLSRAKAEGKALGRPRAHGRSAQGSRAAVGRRRDRVGPRPRVQDQPKHDHARAGRQCLRCDASPRDGALSDGSLSGWCSACRVSALPGQRNVRETSARHARNSTEGLRFPVWKLMQTGI